MLFLFIVGCIAGLIGLGVLLFGKNAMGLIGILVFLGLWTISSVGTVPTREVGVVTSFNKPTGETYTAGAYWKAPWKSVTDMSLAWQTQTYQFEVQAVGSAKIGLDIRPRWRMKESAAPELFQDYKDFEGVRNNLFYNELVDAANKQFQGYNPLTNVDVKNGLPLKSKEVFAEELKTEMVKRLGQYIEIDRIAMPTIAPDGTTQTKISQQTAEFANGKILDQKLLNADKQKAITDKNAQVDKQTRCLEIAAANGGEPGLCLTGGAGVIINSGK